MAIKKIKKSEYEKAKKERTEKYKQERKENVLKAVGQGAVTGFNNAIKIDTIVNTKFELPEIEGEKFEPVSYGAAKALEEGKLREYKPKDDVEKNTINKFLNYEKIPLTTDDGVVHGYIRYSTYEDIMNGKSIDKLKPTSAKEAVAIKKYANHPSVIVSTGEPDHNRTWTFSPNTIGAWKQGKEPDQTNMSSAEKEAIKSYTQYLENKEKQNRINSDPVFKKYGIDPAEFDRESLKKWGEKHGFEVTYPDPYSEELVYLKPKVKDKVLGIFGGTYVPTSQEMEDAEYLQTKVNTEIVNKGQEDIKSALKKTAEGIKEFGKHPIKSTGYFATKLGEGVENAFDDIATFAEVTPDWLLSRGADLVGQDEFSAKMDKSIGERWNDNSSRREIRKEENDNAWTNNEGLKYIGGMFTTTGEMIPAIATELGTASLSPMLDAQLMAKGGNLGYKIVNPATKSGKILKNMTKPSSLVFQSKAFTNYATEAYQLTGDVDKSMGYGALGSILENFTEQIFGGFAGTDVGESLIDFKINNRTARKFVNMATEGGEEIIMTYATPGLKRVTGVDKNAFMPTISEIIESGVGGMFISGIMNMSSAPVNFANKTSTINNLNKVTNVLNNQITDESLKFKPLKITASEQAIEARQQELEDFGNEYAYAIMSNFEDYGDITSEKENIINTGLSFDEDTKAYKNAQKLNEKKSASQKDLVKQLTLNMGEENRLESEKINSATKYAPETAGKAVKTLENELILDDVPEKERKAIVSFAAELEVSLETLEATDKTVESVLRANNSLVETSENLLNSNAKSGKVTDYYSLYEANLDVLRSDVRTIDENFIRTYAENYVKDLEIGNSIAYRALAEKTDNVAEVLTDYILTGNVPESMKGTNIVETAGNNLKSVISKAVNSVASAHSYIYGNETNLSQQAKAIKGGDFSSVKSEDVKRASNISVAMLNTFKPGAMERIAEIMKRETGSFNIERFSAKLTEYYQKNGNINPFREFFTDGGIAVTRAMEGITEQTVTEQSEIVGEYEEADDGVDVSILDEDVEDAELTEEDKELEKESTKKVDDVRKGFGEAGARAYEKVIKTEQRLHSTLSEYELLREFEKSYKDGFQGRKSERQSKLSEQSVKEAEKAGKEDRKGRKKAPEKTVAKVSEKSDLFENTHKNTTETHENTTESQETENAKTPRVENHDEIEVQGKGRIKLNTLHPRQQKAVVFMKGFAKAANMRLVFVANAPTFNGAYDISGDTMYLDIYAGVDPMDKLSDIIIPTASHELTHWMHYQAPQAWNKLSGAVFKALEEVDGISRDARIKNEMARLKGKGLVYNELIAEDEIVARACEDMLAQSETGKKIFNSLSESEQKTIKDKIKSIIQALKDWISDFLSSYKPSNRIEAEKIRQAQDKVDKILKLWNEGIEKSVEVSRTETKAEAFVGNDVYEQYGVELEGEDGMLLSEKNDGSITVDDIKNIQSIDGKSVNKFTSEDITKAEKFARKYFKEMGVKSPFFRAWFGDWRVNDKTPIHIVTEKGAERGTTKNIDTNWNIQISGKVFNETKAHNQNYNVTAQPYLEYINSVVKNAILLDSYTIKDGKSKSDNSAMMHSLYAVADIGNGKEVLKLYVEELNDVNSDGTIKRSYQLQNITNQQTNDRVQENSLAPSASSADIKSVSDLFNFVKQNDKNFNPNPVSKVVNEDGTPKVVYHGTAVNKKFNVFQNKKGTIWFSPSKGYADIYTRGGEKGGKIYSAYISVKNPIYVGDIRFKLDAEIMKRLSENTNIPMYDLFEIAKEVDAKYTYEITSSKAFAQIAKEKGYDGIEAIEGNVKSYAVFEPTQVKSATDNIGTFDKNNPDIRYSEKDTAPAKKPVKKTSEQIYREQNKALMQYIKDEYDKPWRFQPKMEDVKKAANRLGKGYTGDKNLQQEIFRIYRNVKKAVDMSQTPGISEAEIQRWWDIVQEDVDNLAMDIVMNHEEKNDANWKLIKDVRDYMRGRTIKVPAENKGDFDAQGGLEAFRKHNMGRFYISQTKGESIETLYPEMRGMFGNLLPDISNPSDQLIAVSELFDEMAVTFDNPYDADIEAAAESMSLEIMADMLVNIREVKDAKDQRIEAVNKIIETEREKRYAALKRVKDRQDRKIREAKAKAKERAEKRADATARQRLLAVAKKLESLSKKSGPEQQAEIQKLIGHLDLSAVSITGQKLGELTMVKEFYDQMKLNPDFIPDTGIENMLARLEKKQISDLDLQDVIELTNVLLGLEHKLRTDGRDIDTADKRMISVQAEETMKNIENSAGSKASGIGKLADNLITGVLTPVREVQRITGYVETDPLYLKIKDMQKGQVDMFDYQMKAEKMFEKFTEDTKFMESITGAKAKTYTYNIMEKDANGKEIGRRKITLTAGMRISLLLHDLNSSNKKHMQVGGVTIPDAELYKEGKIEEAYARGQKVQLHHSDIKEITANLTEKEREYARLIYRYYNEFSKNEVNKVSVKLKGYEIARVKHYFPIQTDGKFMKQDFELVNVDGTIEGMGFLKERTNAKNPILLRDVASVLDQSIRMNSKYVGLAIPVRNISQLLGKSFSKYAEASEEQKIVYGIDYSITQGYYGSVMNSIAKKWGVNGKEYINKIMQDMQGQKKDLNDIEKAVEKIGSRYVKGVLSLNPKVAFNQIASIPAAMPEVGFKALTRSMFDWGKVDTNQIAEFTPLQYMRSKGAYEATIADMTRAEKGILAAFDKITDKVDMMTWTDTIMTRKLWKAAIYNIKSSRKDLQEGSQEFYEAVAELYVDIMQNTQPNVSMMERPQFLRGGIVNRMLLAFKGEPFKNLNMLYEASANYKAKARQLKQIKNNEFATAEEIAEAENRLKQASKKFRVTVVSQMFSTLLYGIEASIFQLLYGQVKDYWDDEEEKVTFESWLVGVLKNSAINTVTQLPWADQVVGLVTALTTDERYYSNFAPPFLASIENTCESIIKAHSKFQDLKSGKINWQEFSFEANNAIGDVATFFGIPYENLVKNLKPIVKSVIKTSTKNEYIEDYVTLKLDEALVQKSKNDKGETTIQASSATYDILYKAMKNGDKEAYNAIVKDLAERSVEYSDIESKMRNKAEKDKNFDIDKSLGMYAGIVEKPKNETFEKYLDGAEELGIDEDDLKAVVDFAESKKGYKERKKDAENYISGKDFDEASKEFLMNIIADSYSVNDLNTDQYVKYSETRAVYLEKVQREVDLEGKDERDIKKIYNKISDLTEEYALSEASDGEYSMRAKWMDVAVDAEDTLGMTTGRFIEGYVEYGSTIYSKKAMITNEAGYDVFDYLEFNVKTKDLKGEKDSRGKDIKGKTKQDKLIKVLEEMDVPNEVKAYLYSTAYTSQTNNPWKNYLKKDYNEYAEDEK